jgi:hypothetical protein
VAHDEARPGDRCDVREVRTAHGFVALELRVLHNHRVYLTEAHKERAAFHRRVTELRRMLEAEGWTSGATTP